MILADMVSMCEAVRLELSVVNTDRNRVLTNAFGLLDRLQIAYQGNPGFDVEPAIVELKALEKEWTRA